MLSNFWVGTLRENFKILNYITTRCLNCNKKNSKKIKQQDCNNVQGQIVEVGL